MSLDLLEKLIQTGNAAALRDLLNSNPTLAQKTTSYGISPLILSCYFDQPKISEILLPYIAELTIHEAAAIGKFDTIAHIIYHHPELINSYSEDGFTPLGFACQFGHEEVARYLLLKGAEVNAPSKNGFNVYPLHSAVQAEYLDITKILLEAGADVNVAQCSGLTPLHAAAEHGNIELMILLLEAGANVDAKMEDQKTPSHIAAEKGFQTIARILAE